MLVFGSLRLSTIGRLVSGLILLLGLMRDLVVLVLVSIVRCRDLSRGLVIVTWLLLSVVR